MGVKDHKPFFPELGQMASQVRTPNTVSRGDHAGDRAFTSVVIEAGKPVLDREFNLQGDVAAHIDRLLRNRTVPSGWLRGQTRYDSLRDYTFDGIALADVPLEHLREGWLINAFVLPRLTAVVAGMPVIVEFTNTGTPNANVIGLQAPSPYQSIEAQLKRTDFVFLEVWKALVAPSPHARGWVRVASLPAVGQGISIGGLPLVAVAGAPGLGEFQIGATTNDTAQNIAAALMDPGNPFVFTLFPKVVDDTVLLIAVGGGITGNAVTLTSTTAALALSGATLTGGEDRPNKPSQDTLFRHGNTQAATSTALWDEFLSGEIPVETTQRVQLQYRIRVTGQTEAVNFKKHPDGFSTPGIFAQGGRDAPVNDYIFQRADGQSSAEAQAYELVDDGLWVAGLGDETSAQELGSVDGFVYAIPLCFVFRHNSDGFDPVSNTNGALVHDHPDVPEMGHVIPAYVSDRPDNEFCDIITLNSILDLRRHVSPTGFDYASELQYQMESLLDGSLHTWAIDTADKMHPIGGASGDVSTRFLVCNEIGRDADHGGNPPFSGDTERGVVVRNFDHVARRFGSQPVSERLVIAFAPGDGFAANPGKYVETAGAGDSWVEEDVLHLDLDALNASTLGNLFSGGDGGGSSAGALPAQNVGDFMPEGTVIVDVLSAFHDDGNYDQLVDQQVQMRQVRGIGTRHLEVVLDENQTQVNGGLPGPTLPLVSAVGTGGGSQRRIFLEVEVSYPTGVGLTDLPDYPVTPDAGLYTGDSGLGPGAMIEDDAGQRPTDAARLLAPTFRSGYRETKLEYVANGATVHGVPTGDAISDQVVSRDPFRIILPRRVSGTVPQGFPDIVQVTDMQDAGSRNIDPTTTEFGSSSRKVVTTTQLSGNGQTLAEVVYHAQDPYPNYGPDGAGYQISVYFRSHAPQTAGTQDGDIDSMTDGVLPQVLHVEPLLMAHDLWTGQASVGSVDPAYPYAAGLTALPINAGNTPEWALCATGQVTLTDFEADTGLLSLHPRVPADGQNVMEFGGSDFWKVPRKDEDFRAFYPFADQSTYRPAIFAQSLKGSVRHKVFHPFLARAVEDVTGRDGGILWRKNELLLVVLTRYARLDAENTVRFIDEDIEGLFNTTCAAVYRTRNLLLVAGDGPAPVYDGGQIN